MLVLYNKTRPGAIERERASSGKRTQKSLGAHKERILVTMKENKAIFILHTELRFLYWKFDIVRSLYINASFHHLHCITPIIH